MLTFKIQLAGYVIRNYLKAEPFADEMDANTGHHGGLVLEAHSGQVQTATT